MIYPGKQTKKIGECEASHFDASGVNVEVFQVRPNLWLCAACVAKEKETESRQAEVKLIQKKFSEVNEKIQLVTDIHNAHVIPIIELQKSIEVDDTIEPSQKNYVFVQHCKTNFLNYTEKVFETRKLLIDYENAQRAWQVNGQTAAGKLSEKLQAEFDIFSNVSYKPAVVKSVKPTKTKAPRKSGTQAAQEAMEAAKKYNVPRDGVLSLMISQNLSGENAALELLRMLNMMKQTVID